MPGCDINWFVAHTRPRCEKKLTSYCKREQLPATLPLCRATHTYRRKRVTFENPLFPGYVFLRLREDGPRKALDSGYVANLLKVIDQETFTRQLQDVIAAVEAGLEIRQVPEIGPGTRVQIKNGPLQGVEGWVESRHGPATVLIRLDFIGQAAAIQMEARDLEVVG